MAKTRKSMQLSSRPGIAELNENEIAWAEISITSTVLRRAWEIELAQVGLTVPQALVLIAVQSSPEPATPTRLSRLMHREPHTISALLTRMEAQDLIKKERDPSGGNRVRISLTGAGREAFERQVEARKVRNITECLSRRELESLNRMNKKLRSKGAELLREMLPGPYGDALW